MEAYRKAVPVKLYSQEECKSALGTLVGEKFTLKKTFQALQKSEQFELIQSQGPGEWMFENEVEEQSFPLYASSNIKNYISQDRNIIYIKTLDCSITKEELKKVKKNLKTFFLGCKIKQLKKQLPCNFMANKGEFYSEKYEENLFDSQKILKELEKYVPKDAYCVIVITDYFFYNMPSEKSLFSCPIKVMDTTEKYPDDYWLFGLASVKDRVGIVNYKRFSNPFCKIPEEDDYEKEIKQLKELHTKQIIKSRINTGIKKQNQDQLQEEQIKVTEIQEKLEQKQQKPQFKWNNLTQEEKQVLTNFQENEVFSNFLKVLNHEVAHMFGIKHCVKNPQRLANFSIGEVSSSPFDQLRLGSFTDTILIFNIYHSRAVKWYAREIYVRKSSSTTAFVYFSGHFDDSKAIQRQIAVRNGNSAQYKFNKQISILFCQFMRQNPRKTSNFSLEIWGLLLPQELCGCDFYCHIKSVSIRYALKYGNQSLSYSRQTYLLPRAISQELLCIQRLKVQALRFGNRSPGMSSLRLKILKDQQIFLKQKYHPPLLINQDWDLSLIPTQFSIFTTFELSNGTFERVQGLLKNFFLPVKANIQWDICQTTSAAETTAKTTAEISHIIFGDQSSIQCGRKQPTTAFVSFSGHFDDSAAIQCLIAVRNEIEILCNFNKQISFLQEYQFTCQFMELNTHTKTVWLQFVTIVKNLQRLANFSIGEVSSSPFDQLRLGSFTDTNLILNIYHSRAVKWYA
ncbi:hypothetical protein PPERSA_03819 [Pseudocohnilembus persalinus]|uniref:Uncharacterized protein n=1 Tax=Pseudocohnilembus persalinus TaxID=266149 RepID=A0A0V0QV18_PSEPJ|nr:hypothetical protein PPERSA_03819 [Pseudocohnilembus persalinus]|eukprot:KRX05882.1 hypothetical protein PPERSA_03819 [Pseudocohnilembus persalinus]